MTKDPNKEILDGIEENAFYKKSVKEEMTAYVSKENERQREEGVIAEQNVDTIHLEESPDPETKKTNIKIGVWGIAAIAAILVIAIIACMKLAS